MFAAWTKMESSSFCFLLQNHRTQMGFKPSQNSDWDLLIISLYQLELIHGCVDSIGNALLEFGSYCTSRTLWLLKEYHLDIVAFKYVNKYWRKFIYLFLMQLSALKIWILQSHFWFKLLHQHPFYYLKSFPRINLSPSNPGLEKMCNAFVTYGPV